MNSKEILDGPDGMKVEFDASQVFPEDPGQGTPVLVVLKNKETASWNCAINEGETVDGTKFTEKQKSWLNNITPWVDAWCQKHGV